MTNKVIYSSWGYSMTIVDYALILEETDKTVKAVLIGCNVMDDNGKGNGRSYPVPEERICEPFRLHKRDGYRKGTVYYVGTYRTREGIRQKGRFSEYEGKGNYYNTWD